MYYAIKFRLYPTEEQLILFHKTSGCVRWVYNKCLRHKQYMYDTYEKTMSKNYYMGYLPQWKKKYSWLAEPDSQTLQQSLIDLFRAYDRFFKHGSGYPKFKKYSDKRSFRIPQRVEVNVEERKLLLGKIGWCTARGSYNLYLNEKVNSITVSQDTDNNWYASVLIERDTVVHNHRHRYEACGIDLGVVKPLTVCYENQSEEPRHRFGGVKFSQELTKKELRRKKYQKQYSRKIKGSKNQEKAKKKIAKAFYKEKQVRKNFQEQTSVRLASLFRYVIFEDLRIGFMTKSAKGTVDNPGTNVKAKQGLNREMRRLGLSQLVLRTEQKSEKYGSEVIYVNPFRTSQECSICGYTDKENRVSRDLFLCKKCNHSEHADVNAGRNILRKGLVELAQRAA